MKERNSVILIRAKSLALYQARRELLNVFTTRYVEHRYQFQRNGNTLKILGHTYKVNIGARQ